MKQNKTLSDKMFTENYDHFWASDVREAVRKLMETIEDTTDEFYYFHNIIKRIFGEELCNSPKGCTVDSQSEQEISGCITTSEVKFTPAPSGKKGCGKYYSEWNLTCGEHIILGEWSCPSCMDADWELYNNDKKPEDKEDKI